jgi:hypothetical protein
MVHPVPGEEDFTVAAERFTEMWRDLGVPLHMIPGNHDIGDKPSGWLPAPVIDRAAREEFLKTFGCDRHAFDFRGCRFVMFNSSLINSGLPEEEDQWVWLEDNIPREGRCFLALHYPPFLLDADEPDHYDNLADPGRARLLALLRDRPVEAIFSGHVHNVFLSRWGRADMYVLPAIAFVRADYAQLFPLQPSDEEFGRNHLSRLGFCVVDVYPTGHTIHWVHTFGGTDPETTETMMPFSELHPRRLAAPVGVDLRQEWARPVAIAHAGGVDEIGRKYVRNDYPVMQLLSLGLRYVRTPVQDVLDARAAARMLDMAAFGLRFIVFCFDWPTPEIVKRLAAVLPALEAIEVILPADAIEWRSDKLGRLGGALGIPIFLSPLHVSAHSKGCLKGQKTYSHFIQHGFLASDANKVFVELGGGSNRADGLSFRVDRSEPLWLAVTQIRQAARAAGRRAVVHVCLAGTAAAQWGGTIAETACLVAEATLAGWAYGEDANLIIDTFVDLDRGYFPRRGLIDPHCDLNPAGHALQRLATILSKAPASGVVRSIRGARIFQCKGRGYALLLAGTRPSEIGFEPGAKALRLDNGSPVSTVDNGWDERADGMPVLMYEEAPENWTALSSC